LFLVRLRLIRKGHLVEAARLGEYSDFGLESVEASLQILRKKLSLKPKTAKSQKTPAAATEDDQEAQSDTETAGQVREATLAALEALSDKEKQQRLALHGRVAKLLEQDTTGGVTGNAETTATRKLIQEIMAAVVPTRCPHCEARNPRVRKEGAIKLFQMPLSKKDQRANKNSQPRVDLRFESSTIGAFSEFDDDDDDEDAEGEEEDKLPETQTEQKPDDESAERKQKYLNPLEVEEHMRRLWTEAGSLLEPLFGSYRIFFMSSLLVSPNRFRPESSGGRQAGDDRDYLHAHSAMIVQILKSNVGLKKAIAAKEHLLPDEDPVARHDSASERSKAQSTELSRLPVTSKDVIRHWIDLQEAINCYLDSSLASKAENRERPGLRQLLERKEGVFRMKMMGKRVNYAGRSVISPDPYISTDQIGVPEFIARTLTFPEAVHNIDKLKQCVINGAHKHPGANFVEYSNGEKKALENMTHEERKAEAALLNSGGKTVYRHLETGDPLLVNRQPTLHKPSIMAHVARVLPKEQTIRMHYANCKSYNADFDGDEMNIHLPQNYSAVAEAYEIAATHKQYIVPTSGAPIRGLIQDFVVSSVFLSSKETFLDKEQYSQLVYSALNEFLDSRVIRKVHLEVPAVLKSTQGPVWTGKQVISTLLKNLSFDERDFADQYRKGALKPGLNLTSASQLDGSNWGPIGAMEGQVVIRNNELLQGVLDKKQIGDSKFGLIHSFYELYGSKRAGQLLTALGRLLTAHLQYHGFTCGLDDTLVSTCLKFVNNWNVFQIYQ
jgi:DNA-directed RNA polymerase I subunit RPA1